MNRSALLIPVNGNASAVQVSISTQKRLDAAAAIYEQGDLVITSTGYTVNKKPYSNQEGYPVFEAVIAARYLRDEHNIDANSIVAETFSRDTIGNIFLSYQTILSPLKISSVKIVSSAFHLPRVELITRFLLQLFPEYCRSVQFFGCEDHNDSDEVYNAIVKKEQEAVAKLHVLQARIKSGVQFTKWFFEEHLAYNYRNDPQPATPLIQQAY